jgi:RNA polymerase sigma factor (sigma-70 family)
LKIAEYIEKNSELIELCKQGDRKAQYEIYRLYSKAMYNVCIRILNNETEAEDVLQEAFLDAFTKINSFRAESAFGAWLKTIVINKAINQLRSQKLSLTEIDDKIIEGRPDEGNDEFVFEEKQETIQKIKRGMEQLPQGFRVVLSLYLFEGYDHDEISQILSINESTSRSQYLRAKQKLLSIMSTMG